MATALFNAIFRRTPTPTAPPIIFPYNPLNNPYRCKRPWPPDFEQLSQKHQFRLERRYRRRSKLKYARPTWMKTMTLAQWGAILFVVVYGIGWMEVDGKGRTILDGFREKFGGFEVDETGVGAKEEGKG